MTVESARLEYTPRPAVYRRRAVGRALLGVVLLILAGAGWWWRGPILTRVGLMYWQDRCLRFELPADRVVYEEEPVAAAKMLAAGEHVNSGPGWGTPGTVAAVAGHQPACLVKFEAASALPAGTFREGVVFLHELRSRTGVGRLVVIEKRLEGGQPLYAPFELRPTVIEPAGWLRGLPTVMPTTANRMASIDMAVSILGPARIRMFAGQVDPADSAHFMIRYELDDGTGGRGAGVVDGRLSDDGSHVTMTVRDGPARPPSRWGTAVIPDP